LSGGSEEELLPLLSADDHDQATSDTYDQRGLLKTQADALGFVTTNTYDEFGELATQTRTIAQARADTAARTVSSQFEYDLDGQLISRTSDVGVSASAPR